MIRVARLPPKRWEAYKALRLEALRTDPPAFGSSVEEESRFSEDVWRERIKNVIFALSDGTPVGLLSCVYNNRTKTKHIVNIYSVYVTPGYRGQGIGHMLLDRALAEIRKKRRIIKAALSVNAQMRPAVGLYNKAGFVEVGRARNELKVAGRYYDMLLMEKDIRKVAG